MGFLDSFGEHGNIASTLIGLLAQHGGHAQSPEDVHSDPNAISGGIGKLINRFQQSGFGDMAQNWMNGQGQTPDPDHVHQALGSGVIDQLIERTGIPKEQLLPMVSKFLPTLVDHLTPNQRPPEAEEATRFLPDDYRQT